MKIQCDVCERAEAALLCCADEAALCWRCDEQVHAANKLASKHQRVPLLPNNTSSSSSSSSLAAASTQAPICDICQEKAGYFFCLEDRALLCRNCDVGIHTSSPLVSSHQRFLITGVRVGLQQYKNKSSNDNSSSNNTTIDRSNSTSSNCNSSNLISPPALENTSIPQKKMRAIPVSIATEETEEFRPQFQWNELLDLAEFDRCYGLSDPGSSS